MYYIDEFRLNVSCLQTKIRKTIAHFLIKLLNFVDPSELKKCSIDKKIELEFMKVVPKDNKWHHFACSVDFWTKIKGKKKQSKSKILSFVDGKKVNKRKSK